MRIIAPAPHSDQALPSATHKEAERCAASTTGSLGRRTRIRWCKRGLALLVLILDGCGGSQSALSPRGSGASAIYGLWSVFLATTALVFVLVMAALVWAMLRRRGPHSMDTPPEVAPDPTVGRRLTRATKTATGATVLILLALAVATYAVVPMLFPASPRADLRIEVIGHRWWWEVRYDQPGSDEPVVTANEIHLPVSARVQLVLRSDDVIHSFWAPSLAGKMDLIPGQTNELLLRADHAGVYRAQCAEFCGMQHANMAMLVIAEPLEQFQHWLDGQRRPALDPANPEETEGRAVFEANCNQCHRIRGTPATGTTGPDLTHLASRAMIGAATLPNNPGNLGGWISDAQQQKPGVLMPPMRLKPGELQSLLQYLGTLQ